MANCATSTVGQLAVSSFLDKGGYERPLRTMKMTLMQNTSRLIERIGEHFPSNTRVTRPAGGMTLWLELDDKIDTTHLSHQALSQRIPLALVRLTAGSKKQRVGRERPVRSLRKPFVRQAFRLG